MQQPAHRVGVQALHRGLSCQRRLLDATFHHAVLDDGDDECVSLCKAAVQRFLWQEEIVSGRCLSVQLAIKEHQCFLYLVHVFQLFLHHLKVGVIV